MKVKCPNCGRTAQVKQERGNVHSCGCGCYFDKEGQPIFKLAYEMIQTILKMRDK